MNTPTPHFLFEGITPIEPEAMRYYLSLIARGICPFCRCDIGEQRRIEQRVYAVPCWHRLYSGTLPEAQHEQGK